MRSDRWRIRVATGAGSFLLLAIASSPGTAQPRDRTAIKATIADWQSRQKAVKVVRYTLSGTVEFLKPLSPDSPRPKEGDRSRPYRATILFDFERNRFRMHETQFVPKEGGGYQERDGTVTFDGTESRQHQRRDIAASGGGFDLLISKASPANQQGMTADDLHWPLLFGHGFIPTVQTPADLERLPRSWDTDDFLDRGRHQLRGSQCRVFRTEPANGPRGATDEIWVAPDRRSAILRYVHLSDGQPWVRVDVEWAESAIGWMPKSWTSALTAGGKDVARLYHIKVDRMETDPNMGDADFTVPAVPGMEQVIVAEPPPPGVRVHPGHPGRRVYRIASDGEWIEIGAEGWRSLDEKTTYPLRAQLGWWPWVVSAVGLLMGGWLVSRRLRRRAAPAAAHTSEGTS